MTDAYSYWTRGLIYTQGLRPLTRAEMSALHVSEEDIGCGFFRMRPPYAGTGKRPGFTLLVAIWEVFVPSEDGTEMMHERFATVDAEHVDPQEIWLRACRYPIHEAQYRSAIAGEAA